MSTSCPKCRSEGWLCEEHPLLPFPHDDCPGPGVPCTCNPGADNPPGFKVICDREEKPS